MKQNNYKRWSRPLLITLLSLLMAVGGTSPTWAGTVSPYSQSFLSLTNGSTTKPIGWSTTTSGTNVGTTPFTYSSYYGYYNSSTSNASVALISPKVTGDVTISAAYYTSGGNGSEMKVYKYTESAGVYTQGEELTVTGTYSSSASDFTLNAGETPTHLGIIVKNTQLESFSAASAEIPEVKTYLAYNENPTNYSTPLTTGVAVDYLVSATDVTKTFYFKNTGNVSMTTNISVPTGYTHGDNVTIAPGETKSITITLHPESGQYGVKQGNATISFGEGFENFTFALKGVSRDPTKYYTDFASGWPLLWTNGENWSTNNNGAYQYSSNSETSLTTCKMTFATGEIFAFIAKKYSSNNYASLKVQYSATGAADSWTDAATYTYEDFTSDWATYAVTNIPEGSYFVRFYGKYIYLTSVYGGVEASEPNIVFNNSAYNFGLIAADTPQQFTITNSGLGALSGLSIGSSDNNKFTVEVDGGATSIPGRVGTTNGSVNFTVTAKKGSNTGTIEGTISINGTGISEIELPVSATIRDESKIYVDFTNAAPKPDDWTLETGWSVNDGGFARITTTGSYYSTTGAYIRTPMISSSGESLIVKYRNNYSYSNTSSEFKIYYSANNTDWTEATYTPEFEYNVWKTAIVTIPNTAKYIAIWGKYVDVDYIYGCKHADAPKSLAYSGLTDTSATITWTAGGSETAWELYYSTENTPGSGTKVDVSTNPSYNLTGLTQNTKYYIYVRGVKAGSTYTEWSAPIDFTTKQSPVNLTTGSFADNFEGENNWVFVNGNLTNQWVIGSATNNGGSKSMYISKDGGTSYQYNTSGYTLVYATKLFTLSAGKYEISYDWKCNGESTDYLRAGIVPASVTLTAGNSYDAVSAVGNSGTPSGWTTTIDGETRLWSSTSWANKAVEANIETEGNYYVVFAWKTDGSGGFQGPAAIDNFSITKQACPKPTNVATTEIKGTKVTIGWDTAEDTSWEVYISTESAKPEASQEPTASPTTNSHQFTGLTAGTHYYAWVRAVKNTAKSDWVGVDFTPEYPVPTALTISSIKSTSATLTWTADAEDTAWEVACTTTNTAPTTAGTEVATASYNFTGLTANTQYYAWVRSKDGTNYSSWSSSYSFKTAYNTPFEENFGSSSTPTGWTKAGSSMDAVLAGTAELSGDGYWSMTQRGTISGYHPTLNLYGTYKGWFITPNVELGTNKQVSFKLALTGYNSTTAAATTGTDDRFAVLVSSNNGDSWTKLKEWNNSSSENVLNNIATAGEDVAISLAAYNNQSVKVAFYAESTESNADNDIHIGNVEISDIPACPKPTGLKVDSYTYNSATLSWTKGSTETEWKVIYGPAGFDPASEGTTINNVTENPYTLTGLTPEAEYDVYVKAVIDENVSPVSDKVNFTTSERYPAPTGVTSTNVTATTATISWTANGDETAWEYSCSTSDAEPNVDGDYSETTVDATTVNLTNLNDNSTYYVYVRSKDNTNHSAWSAVHSFDTPQAAVDVTTASYADDFTDASKWKLINGTKTNAWTIGDAATTDDSKAIYISNDGGTTNDYSNSYAAVYATKLFHFAEGTYNISYDWKANGHTNYDYLRVAIAPANTVLTAGNNLYTNLNYQEVPNGWIAIDGGSQLKGNSSWANKEVEATIAETGDYMVVFAWTNDDSNPRNNPPAAVKNFNIEKLTCFKPTALTVAEENITTESAVLSWTSEADAWQVQYKLTTAEDWTDVANNVETNPTYTLTGLTPNTRYQVRVRTYCDNTHQSKWTDAVSFKTKKVATTIGEGFADDFETDKGWELINGTQTNKWVRGTAASYGGEYGLYISNGTSNEYDNSSATVAYAMKYFSFAAGDYTVAYDWKALGEDNYWDYLRVFLAPDVEFTAGTLYSGLAYNTLPTGWIALDGGYLSGKDEWQNKSVNVSIPAGSYNVVFLWRNDGSVGDNPPAAIDNFSITPRALNTPTDLAASSITATSASLDWKTTSTEEEWQVKYGPADFDVDAEPDEDIKVVAVTAHPYNLTGLTAETTYDVYVRGKIGGNYSSWSTKATFTTLETYPRPTAVTAASINSNSAVISWTKNGLETAWEIAVKTTNATPTEAGTLITENPYTITGLEAETTYYVFVRSKVEENYSGWSLACSFKTTVAPVATYPYTENFNNVASESIPQYWDNAEGTTQYDDQKWQRSGQSVGTSGYCMQFNSKTSTDGMVNYLKSRPFSWADGAHMKLGFYYKNAAGGDLSVYVSTNGGATYPTELATGLTGKSDWTLKEIDIPAAIYGDNVVIVFKATSNHSGSNNGYIYLDDFKLTEIPSYAMSISGDDVNEGTIAFGEVKNTTTTKTFTITNNGFETLTGISVVSSDASVFTVSDTDFDLARNASKEITVTFVKGEAGDYTKQIAVTQANIDPALTPLTVTGTYVAPTPATMAVKLGGEAVGATVPFGVAGKARTKTFTIENTGEATLNITSIVSDNTADFTVAPASLDVLGGETGEFTVTFKWNENDLNAVKTANITLTASNAGLEPVVFAVTGTRDNELWIEEFTGTTMPDGWELEGEGSYWSFANGYAAGTSHPSNTQYLVTPALAVQDGDVMTFEYKRTNYSKLTIEQQKDGGAWTGLHTDAANVTDTDWQTFTISGLDAGRYKFRFKNDDLNIDNFEGFKIAPAIEHAAEVTAITIPATGNQYVEYTASIDVKVTGTNDEQLTAKFFIGDTQYGSAVVKDVTSGNTETFQISFTPDAAITDDAYFTIESADITAFESDKTAVNIAAATVWSENETVNPFAEGTYPSAVLGYTPTSGWGTIALPFAVNDLSIFGTEVDAFEFDGFENGELKFKKVNSLTNYTPYLIHVTTPTAEPIKLFDVTISGFGANDANCTTAKNGVTLQGTYTKIVDTTLDGMYGVTNTNKIAKGNANTAMKGMRAYFNPGTVSLAGARISIYDEATGITRVYEAAELFGDNDRVYNLKGQRVENAKKGVYIVNGKQVVVK